MTAAMNGASGPSTARGPEPARADAPKASMLQLVNSYRLGQLLSVAARLGVADILQDGPKPVGEIAAATGTVAPFLYRALRALAGLGVFEELQTGTFALTPLASTLRSTAPVSLRGAAAMIGDEWHWNTWAGLGHSVATGEPAWATIHGISFDDAYETDSRIAPTFDQATEDLEKLAAASIRAAYSFEGVRTIVDVEAAGGFGGLLFAILAEYPDMRGVFVDRASVARRAAEAAERRGLAHRCSFQSWSGIAPLPEGGDVYLLRNVLRDHDDDGCRAVLSRCREAMKSGARLLIVEMLVASGNEMSLGKIIDIDALLFTPHGRERGEREYGALLEAEGFRVERVIPTPGPLTLIECIRSQGEGR